ncbi:ABC transporter permease [Ktedonobacteria bacterium brp13]|nr:ABC transporter permease [Ktedonobacteria bacterium brp13]
MTFVALLIKEMRLMTRRERTVWLMVGYIVLLGIIGWFELHSLGNTDWSSIGTILYTTLLIIQFVLVLFVTPAFTTTMINGEKERQTFDMLLCSRLSPAALIGGKLLSGLINALLLIVSSIPLFSLVFFFGGISPLQAFEALLIFAATALFLATFGIFCSSLVSRPAVSTALAYIFVLLWCGLPLLFYMLQLASGIANNGVAVVSSSGPGLNTVPAIPAPPFYLAWNPIVALFSTFSVGTTWAGPYQILHLHIMVWQLYLFISVLVSALLFAASMLRIRPEQRRSRDKRYLNKKPVEKPIETKVPVEA